MACIDKANRKCKLELQMIHKPSGMGQHSTIYIQYMYDGGKRNIDYNVNVGRGALRVRLRDLMGPRIKVKEKQ